MNDDMGLVGESNISWSTVEGAPRPTFSEQTYETYRDDRLRLPEMSVEHWAAVYGETAVAMEARYRQERYQNIFASAKQDWEIGRFPNWDWEDYQIEAWRQFLEIFPPAAPTETSGGKS